MELYNDDCFEILPEIKDGSVDLVVVDLPYAQTSCKWDCMIDLERMWKELKRCCKRDCVYVFFCTTKFGYKLIQSNERWFRYDIVWEKSRKVGFLSANKMPLRKHEMMYVFKEQQGTYNAQKTEGKPYKIKGGKKLSNNMFRNEETSFNRMTINNKGDRHPTSILNIPEAPEDQEERKHEMVYIFKEKQGTYNPQKTEGHKIRDWSKTKNIEAESYYRKDGETYKTNFNKNSDDGTRHPTTIVKFNNPKKSLHRTQKPVALCEWLIKSYSNQGDLVLDFTMGSGTTGHACKNTNRKFIGIERDEEIFKTAYERLMD